MPVYQLSTRINSNVSPDCILYDLSISRVDCKGNNIYLVNVHRQQIQADYSTQQHATENINEPLSTIYIMEINLYHRTMLRTTAVLAEPFTRMYTLDELSTGRAWSPVKRENPCYFVTTAMTRPARQGPNVTVVKISRPERPFIAKDYPIGDPQDPFEGSKIRASIQDRVNYLSYPSQNETSLCGPAAFFYCLQRDRPDVYEQAAKELWLYGKTKIGGLEIAPGEGCRHPAGNFDHSISGLDWMTLAGLRDSANSLISFDDVNSSVAGITLWPTLTEWFVKAGYEKVFSNVGVTQAGVEGIRELNEYIQKGYTVVTLINDSLLEGSNNKHTTFPNHWIVWAGPAIQQLNGSMQLKLFSWGQVEEQIKEDRDSSFFVQRLFGGVVFKPLK